MSEPTHRGNGTPASPGAATTPPTFGRTLIGRAAEGIAMTAGWGLGTVFGVVAAVRRARPLHAGGTVVAASLTIEPAAEPAAEISGVPLLDEPGEYSCLVRESRAAGVPAPAPDVAGMALRITITEAQSQRPADLLFASTGTGSLSRYRLSLRRGTADGPMTTLLPMAASTGPLVLALLPDGTDTRRLAWAHLRGNWHECGTLRILREQVPAQEQEQRFDGIANPLPGLAHYAAVRA